MPGSAGSKYGIIEDGLPAKPDARQAVLNKLRDPMPTFTPGETVKLRLTADAKKKFWRMKKDDGHTAQVKAVGETSKEILIHTASHEEEWLTFDDVEPLT